MHPLNSSLVKKTVPAFKLVAEATAKFTKKFKKSTGHSKNIHMSNKAREGIV